MSKTALREYILEEYRKGVRYFEGLDIENEDFDGENLDEIVFENCRLYCGFKGASLKGAQFLNGGIKTCDFTGADLTNAKFQSVSVECAVFMDANTEGVIFDGNWAYANKVTQLDFDTWFKNEKQI